MYQFNCKYSQCKSLTNCYRFIPGIYWVTRLLRKRSENTNKNDYSNAQLLYVHQNNQYGMVSYREGDIRISLRMTMNEYY